MSVRARLVHATLLARKRPKLADALLCGTLPTYLFSRLRPMMLYRLLGFCAHLTELLMLMQILPNRSLITSVALHNLCSLGSTFFWGMLEPVRERARRTIGASETIALATPFLTLAIALSALLLGGSFTALVVGKPGLARLYATAIILRLVFDLLTRGLQIPIAARTRIFRPPIWFLVRPLLAPLILVASWRLVGAIALPLAVALSALVQFAVNALYTLRSYRALRLPAPQPRPRQLRLLFRNVRARRLLAGGLAGALPMSANLMICALAVAGAASNSRRDMLVVLHALIPLLLAAGGWVQIVYVDLHWLMAPWRAAMLRRFESALEIAAPLVVLALAPLLLMVARMFAHRQMFFWVFASLPLLWAQAWISTLQLGLFVRGRFRALAVAGAVQLGGVLIATIIIARFVHVHGAELALICAGVDLLLVFALRRRMTIAPGLAGSGSARFRDLLDEPEEAPPTIFAWVRALSLFNAPVQIGALILPHNSSALRRILIARLEELAGARGIATIASAKKMFFVLPGARAQTEIALLALGGGMIRRVAFLAPAPTGRAALDQLRRSHLLSAADESGGASEETTQAADALFAQLVQSPEKHTVDLARGRCPPAVRALPLKQRRRLLASAERAARGAMRLRDPLATLEPIIECRDGVLQKFLVAPVDAPPLVRAELRRRAYAAALETDLP